MKSFLSSVLCLWLLFFCEVVFSQGSGDRGLLLGFNSSTFTGSEPSIKNNSHIPGLTIGFFQVFDIGPGFSFTPELAFTTKGSCLQTIGDLYLHQIITYMELPLLARWTLHPGDRIGVYLCGGPALAFMLLAFNEVGFPEEIHRFDMGVVLGIGVGRRKLGFRIHVNQGLTDLDHSTSISSVRNQCFSLTMGLAF